MLTQKWVLSWSIAQCLEAKELAMGEQSTTPSKLSSLGKGVLGAHWCETRSPR